MQLDHPPFDVTIIGCGLAESIASAALAHSGKSVLHLDQNDYYGADHASLTLTELIQWATARLPPPPSASTSSTSQPDGPAPVYVDNQRRRFQQLAWSFPSNASNASASHSDASASNFSANPTEIPPSLRSVARSFSISLSPLLVPSTSPLIDSLIVSGVSRYSTFRLLESTSIFLPGSAEPAEGDEAKAKAVAKTKKVPGSKEDVFKDKTIGLVDKRRLMKILMWIMGDFEGTDELLGKESEPFPAFLQSAFSLSDEMTSSLTYALAHCLTPSDRTLPSLLRVRSYLRSVGRYGNSPFLIGQYGGAGEVAQGFCRLSAVQGTIYILSHPLESISYPTSTPTSPSSSPSSSPSEHIDLQIKGFTHPIQTSQLIIAPDYLPSTSSEEGQVKENGGEVEQGNGASWARCVAIVDRIPDIFLTTLEKGEHDGEEEEGGEAEKEGATPDTGLLVFPPGSLGEMGVSVSAVLMGEGTASCPKGFYILYLSAPLPSSQSASDLLPFLHEITGDVPPLFQLTYLEQNGAVPSSPLAGRVHVVRTAREGEGRLTEEAGRCAKEGERLFGLVWGTELEEGKGFFLPKAEFGDEDDEF